MTDPCCEHHEPGRATLTRSRRGVWELLAPCCDGNDCGPCCENCPTCPTLHPVRILTDDESEARIEAAYTEVFRLCSGPDAGRWRMSIPADPTRDSDLIICAGLDARRAAGRKQ